MSQQLLKNRKSDVKKYFEGDLQTNLLHMLECLRGRGMNIPLTDDESSERAVQPCTHWWLSPEILPILHGLDDIRKQGKKRQLLPKIGNRPLHQTNEVQTIWHSPPTPSLPKNWYRPEWYTQLDKSQQIELRPTAAEDLPNIVRYPQHFLGFYE
jgi:hypothetical protein